MIGIGAMLLALGVADLVAGGLTGEPRSYWRAFLGIGFGLALVLVIAWAGALSITATWTLVTLTLVGGGWMLVRCRPRGSSRATWALGFLTGAVGGTVALSGTFQSQSPALQALRAVDVPSLASLMPSELVLMAGTVVFLVASTNGVVRAVLDVAGTEIERSQQQLRGGRLIGPIERLLIYGLAVMGEPTAAALIVSAKSLLRFPELSRVAKQEDEGAPAHDSVALVDSVTEYFLLGSLASWFVALVLALLIYEP